MEQALLVFGGGDVNLFEVERFRDGEVDLQRGDECLGGLVVELEALDRLKVAEVRSFGSEFAEVFQRTGLVIFRQGRGDRLDFVADEDDAVDGDIGKIETELSKVPRGVFADDAQQREAFRVGCFDRLAGAVRAHPVAGVAGDQAFLEKQGAGVAGADVNHESGALAHRREMLDAAAGLEVDQAGHFPVIDHGNRQPAGDANSIQDRFMVRRLVEDVGGDGAGEIVWIEAEFGKCLLVAADDGDDALGGGVRDHVAAEDVLRERRRLLQEVDGGEVPLFVALGDDDRHGAGADV